MISGKSKRIKNMATLRYVKTPAELQEAAENNLEFFVCNNASCESFLQNYTRPN